MPLTDQCDVAVLCPVQCVMWAFPAPEKGTKKKKSCFRKNDGCKEMVELKEIDERVDKLESININRTHARRQKVMSKQQNQKGSKKNEENGKQTFECGLKRKHTL